MKLARVIKKNLKMNLNSKINQNPKKKSKKLFEIDIRNFFRKNHGLKLAILAKLGSITHFYAFSK